MDLATRTALQATDQPVATYTFEGEERKPETVPEWVAAILQKAGMEVVVVVDRMCDLKWKGRASIDVSISDSNRIAAIHPTEFSWTRSLVSDHVQQERAAVINVNLGDQSFNVMMPLESEDVKTNARRVIVAIADLLARHGLQLEGKSVGLGEHVHRLLSLSL